MLDDVNDSNNGNKEVSLNELYLELKQILLDASNSISELNLEGISEK